jgi:undecaprenyl-diphosphatase
MLDFLLDLDKKLFLLINGWHSPAWDYIMYAISSIVLWVPLYLTVIFFIFRKQKIAGLITLFTLILLVVLTDQGSVQLFKNVFHRFRPCHCPDLEGLVHLVKGKCGGQYGFISSHAANCFGFAVFSLLIFKNKYYTAGILFWATLVIYSRVYLGVHYPGDVTVGAIFGSLVAWGLFKLYSKYYPTLSPLLVKKNLKE